MLKYLLLAALIAITMANTSNAFIKSKNGSLFLNDTLFYIRGVALLDDSTVWEKNQKNPNLNHIKERDYALTKLGEINTVRLVLKMDYFINQNGDINDEGFRFVDQQLSWANKHNLLILLDMHILPGGAIQDFMVTADNKAFWDSRDLQDMFVSGWRAIAERYRDNQTVLGYELMNESIESGSKYWQLMERTTRAIRSVDSNHLITIQTPQNQELERIDDTNLAYVFHFYTPLYFTHQNVNWTQTYKSDKQIEYPGKAKNHKGFTLYFDKDALRKTMQQIANYKERFNAPIILGEFCVSTFASEDSKKRWITDVVNLTQENNLNGYIYWRQIDSSGSDLSRRENATTAVINDKYFSPAQFFSIRPNLDQGFDVLKFFTKSE